MPATPFVIALSLISGVLCGIGPVFSKLGMERGGRPRRATLIVLVVGLLSLPGGSDIRFRLSKGVLFPLVAAVFAAISNVVNRFGVQTSTATPLDAAAINLTSALQFVIGHTLGYHSDALTTPDRSDAYLICSGVANAAAVFRMFTGLANGPVVVAPLVSTSLLFTTALAYLFAADVETVTAQTVASAVLTVTARG